MSCVRHVVKSLHLLFYILLRKNKEDRFFGPNLYVVKWRHTVGAQLEAGRTGIGATAPTWYKYLILNRLHVIYLRAL